MTDLPVCPNCGLKPCMTLRSRGTNWGSAEIRCSNGCLGIRAGHSFPPGGEAAAKELLKSKWKALINGEEKAV